MKKKILLIEDDQLVRSNTIEILELANYTVKGSKNGKEGVSMAKAFLPDLIVCDILMPELDGYGVLQIVSKTPKLEQIPVIFLSAKTDHESIRKGMEMGADDYISKPFEESELLRAIESRLKRVEVFEQKTTSFPKHLKVKKTNLKSIKDIDRFLTQKKVFSYKKGEAIYCQGNISSHIFLIKKGWIKTFKTDAFGKQFIINYFTNNQYFGYTSFAKHLPHFENSEALTKTELYKISKDEITAMINNNHHIIYSFIDLLADDLVEMKDKLLLTAYGSVRRRTALTLLNLLKIFPQTSNNIIVMKRKDLADTIGIAKETLIRTLHDFRNENLIELTTKDIKILNKEGLSNMQ